MTAVDVDALEARGFCTCAGITPPHGPLCDAPIVTALIAEVRRGRVLREAVEGLAEELDGWRENARRYEQHALAEGSQDPANHAHVRALAYERAIEGLRAALRASNGEGS